MKHIFSSYLDAKRQADQQYLQAGLNRISGNRYQNQTSQTISSPIISPHDVGRAARQEAKYAGQGRVNAKAAQVFAHETAVLNNIETMKQFHQENVEERKNKKAQKQKTKPVRRNHFMGR